MPGTRVQQTSGVEVDVDVNSRDIVTVNLTAQVSVDAFKNFGWLVGHPTLRRRRGLDHRRDQGSRNTVTRHIGDEQTQMVVADWQTVIQVSSDRGHRDKSSGERGPRRLRELRWEQRLLNLIAPNASAGRSRARFASSSAGCMATPILTTCRAWYPARSQQSLFQAPHEILGDRARRAWP